MLKQLFKIPNTICLAFSGGVDSLAVAHFLKTGNKDLTLLHFNHGCQYSNEIEAQCIERAHELKLPIVIGKINQERPKKQSLEDFWRRQRYNFLRTYAIENNQKLLLAHHISDSVETWLMTSLHGTPKLIPAYDETVIRPFIITEKQDFQDYATRHNLVPVDDPYNRENHLMRNYIRANVMQHIKYINPGINKVIKKKYLNMVVP